MLYRPLGVRDMRTQIRRVAATARDADITFSRVDHPVVSIVIPAFNNWELTRRCLASVSLYAPPDGAEVILVDDSSSDETALLSGAIPGLRTVRLAANSGFTHAANSGARAARATYTFFLNNDTLLLPGCLEALLRAMEDRSIGAVGARLVYPTGWLQEVGSLVRADGTGVHRGWGRSPADARVLGRTDVDYCSAAALMVRSAALREAGYFDERFSPAYYEDVDLCFTLRAQGLRVVVEPAATVVHWEGMTHGTELRKGTSSAHTKRSQEINRLMFMEKWHEHAAARPA